MSKSTHSFNTLEIAVPRTRIIGSYFGSRNTRIIPPPEDSTVLRDRRHGQGEDFDDGTVQRPSLVRQTDSRPKAKARHSAKGWRSHDQIQQAQGLGPSSKPEARYDSTEAATRIRNGVTATGLSQVNQSVRSYDHLLRVLLYSQTFHISCTHPETGLLLSGRLRILYAFAQRVRHLNAIS